MARSVSREKRYATIRYHLCPYLLMPLYYPAASRMYPRRGSLRWETAAYLVRFSHDTQVRVLHCILEKNSVRNGDFILAKSVVDVDMGHLMRNNSDSTRLLTRSRALRRSAPCLRAAILAQALFGMSHFGSCPLVAILPPLVLVISFVSCYLFVTG